MQIEIKITSTVFSSETALSVTFKLTKPRPAAEFWVFFVACQVFY